MKKLHLFTFCFIGLLHNFYAQEKKASVEEIYQGEFRTEGMDVLRSLNNGKQYTILNSNRTNQTSTIDKYDYSTLKKWRPWFLLSI